MVGVGVIGYGYWGPNLARNFSEAKNCRLAGGADLSPDRLAVAGKRHSSSVLCRDYRDLLKDASIDAVAISTPVSTHYELAIEALRSGKHVMVEKPLAETAEQSLRLIEEAQRRNLVLMVDHTFVYTGAVRKIKELMNSGQVGDIYYYDSVRVNLGLFQQDVDVIWDLAVHDLSIMNYILADRPCAVSATGARHVAGRKENIAYLTLFFDSNLIGHIHVNWLSPVKVRQTLVGGSQKMIVYDDMHLVEKVRIYDRGIIVNNNPEDMYKILVGYRTGDMLAPQIDNTEALLVEANHFVRCIENGEAPISGGQAGLDVVRILEAATASMADRGRPVKL